MNEQLTTEKWEELKELYGDNAYLMLQREYVVKNNWTDLTGNHEFESNHSRLKTSAALPFDLERAKAGDVVEAHFSEKEGWMSVSFSKETNVSGMYAFVRNEKISYHWSDDLRMKYPPRIHSQ